MKFIAICLIAFFALEIEGHSNKYEESMTRCMVEYDIAMEDMIEKFAKKHVDNQYACFIDCIMKKENVITSEGKLDLKQMEREVADEQEHCNATGECDELENMKCFLECSKVAQPDQEYDCAIAANILKCMISKGQYK